MRVPKLDLRTAEQVDEPKKYKRLAVFFIVLFLFTAGAALSENAIFSDHPVIDLGANTFLGQIRSLVKSGDRKLAGESDDRVNILILGVGGAGHDGPELTDTVILASFKPSIGKVALLSIPRDLLVHTDAFGDTKLNSINAYAEAKVKGSGPETEAKALAELLDEPIDYWARIDFSGFQKIIDAVGGVDITVDRSFADNTFPVGGGSDLVKTISFSAGAQHMDGQTALDYSRSRHGSNGEASDFARSKRQEKVILALREKMLKAGTLLNPFTLNSLLETVRGSLATNLETWEALRLAREASSIKTSEITTKVMSDENVLVGGINSSGMFVLTPKDGNWSSVAAFAQNVFEGPKPIVADPAKPATVRLEIQNGTTQAGLAQHTASLLGTAGYKVSKIGNAATRGYDKTVIYDLTGGKMAEAVGKIKDLVDANVAPDLPASIPAPEDTDLLIILGKNATL